MTGLTAGMILSGCARTPYRFAAAPPVTEAGDRSPSPVPETTDFNIREYMMASSVRYPLVRHLDFRRIPRGGDVNALDQVPASAWYEPRLGKQNLSPEDLVKGPEQKGAPQNPLTVVKVKDLGSAPGFTVRDARGYRYLIKLDNLMAPNLETTVDYVVNRLFWGFGYHVPEDYVLTVHPNDLHVEAGSKVRQEDVDNVLVLGVPDNSGRFRVTASLMLEGTVLGATPQVGTRKGDIHDTVRHENRRTLRALYVFGSWLNHTGIRSDNTLDVYEGEAGQGHTVHYMLDFGEAMGLHGLNYLRRWEGHEHFFDWDESLSHYLGLGLRLRNWEKIEGRNDALSSYFESGHFDPASWRESFQFQPARLSRPDDDYWAAKILAAVKQPHLEALFQAAGHPDPDEVSYLIRTLMERREKVLRYQFSRVTPLEIVKLEGESLTVKDEGFSWRDNPASSSFEVTYFNDKRREAAAPLLLNPSEKTFVIPVPESVLTSAGDYLRVEVRYSANGNEAPRAAGFHIRRGSNGLPAVVGVTH